MGTNQLLTDREIGHEINQLKHIMLNCETKKIYCRAVIRLISCGYLKTKNEIDKKRKEYGLL